MNARKKIALFLSATALTAGLTVTGLPAAVAAPAKAAAPAAECGVRSDGRLYCGNAVGAKGYADRSYRSATRGELTTGFNWFACWGHGDPHQGGNDIWYWTQLDNGAWGNVPAVSVRTGQDPAPGLREC
ncbi:MULTISPECIES: hypothetical protein [Streptomyces]|uniref:hypothetical protein n=1 Tax=Streptomyces TaxID=1883 RepID=UPI000C26F06F|nr:hypothetical protein [Streptomyces sp. CB01201]MBX7464651.1 hypothetical protein [Streptomyces sp. MAG02]PJN04715.1 hypothetical protein CG740_02105 [Streptomyces sp. CB01201]